MHNSSIGEEEDAHIAAINIIPLVDVVLVLLIIFMVTTVFSKDSALKLDLPKGAAIVVALAAGVALTYEKPPAGRTAAPAAI